jgi:preprotein translocase subunit SecE
VDIKKIVEETKQFFREVKSEFKKVAWPQRKETIASTSVVLVIVLIISLYLGIVDAVLSRIVKTILG